jgi:cytochrome c peroxidase
VETFMIRRPPVLRFLLTALSLAGCSDPVPDPTLVTADGPLLTITIEDATFATLPPAPEVDAAARALGRDLFWDPILSGDQDIACATCHLPEFGYADGVARSIGVGGQGRGPDRTVGHTGRVPRNAQGVLNTVFNGIDATGDLGTSPMFWDNRASGLVEQARGPVHSLEEMRGDNVADEAIEALIVARLTSIPEYVAAFETVYGPGPITMDHVTESIATFESTLVATNSPFDRWMRGDPAAMDDVELRGMQDFVEVGCAACHDGPMFSDFELHVLGVPDPVDLAAPDRGDGEDAFRTPTLRQLDHTGPYLHAGQAGSLADVLEFYDEAAEAGDDDFGFDFDDDDDGDGGDGDLAPALPASALADELTDLEDLDGRARTIEAFLHALNDDDFDRTEPASVPSGLPPGGR